MIKNINWYEKYRPSTFNEYVFVDETLKTNVAKWIAVKEIPHLFVYGTSGTGKSTLINLLIKELKLEEDSLIINASKTNGIDEVRESVSNFAPLSPINATFKVIVFEECENLTKDAQNALKMLVEQYTSVCRFIFVCNEPQKINPAIRGRCQNILIEKMDKKELLKQLIQILVKEEVKYAPEILASYINKYYPNFRSILNYIQYNVDSDRVLKPLVSEDDLDKDLYQSVWDSFMKYHLMEGRKSISSRFSVEDINKMYKWVADNIPEFTKDVKKQFEAFVAIKEGMYESLSSIDPEICLSGTLTKVCMILNK